VLFELLAGGDYLFDPEAGSRYSKDEDHIAQIIELVGEFPQPFASSGKYSSQFFNRKGEVRHINKLRYWPLEDVLHDKYEFTRETAQTIASFLGPMLRLIPEKRAGAGELVHHRWLDGVVVQGEVDVICRAEDDEARWRSTSPGLDSVSGVVVVGNDALKPVEDDSPAANSIAPMGTKQTCRIIPDLQFRVLVLGRANAGKTSILQRVCETTESPKIYRGGEEVKLDPSMDRGEHTIEDELVFSNHTGYVFHDSRGIESGSTEELEILKDFIHRKCGENRLRDIITCNMVLRPNG